jgi:hypothetical protein
MVYDNYSTNNLIQLFAGYLLFKFHKYALYFSSGFLVLYHLIIGN